MINFSKNRSVVTVNGVTVSGSGNIVISNGKILVGGQDITPDSKTINIEIKGDVDSLEVDYCESIKIEGNVKKVQTVSGNVTCKNVEQGIKSTSGDIEAENVIGDVNTISGDIRCGDITGSVKTVSGDIKRK